VTQPLVADDVLGGILDRAVLVAIEIDLDSADELLALGAHGEAFMTQHRAHPRERLRGRIDAHTSDEDLDGALIGVVRVVGAMREAPREPQQLRRVLLDELQHRVFRAVFPTFPAAHPCSSYTGDRAWRAHVSQAS
jgi:hypothetical protein